MIRPEDEAKISQMTTALRLSREKACILLVSFNDELLRRDIEAEIDQLAKDLWGLTQQELEDIQRSLDELR